MRASSVVLTLIPEAAMRALLAGSLQEASEIIGLDLPEFYLTQDRHWRSRLEMVHADPAVAPWLARAVYGRPAGAVVGRAGFHGPPDARDMVEIGYAMAPDFRRRGYAGAAVGELLTYAAEHGAWTVRASVSVKNVASLAVIRGHGFQQVAEHWNDEDGQELIFERPCR